MRQPHMGRRATPLLTPTTPPGVSEATVKVMLEAARASHAQEMKTVAESTAALIMEQLKPVLKGLGDEIKQTTARTDALHAEASLDAVAKRERDAMEVAAGEQDIYKEQVEEKERRRINQLIPPKELLPDRNARPRGGRQRLPMRLEIIERLRAQKGEMTLDEVQELKEALELGLQVPPASSSHQIPPVGLSVWGVEAEASASRSAPGLFGHLQQHKLAPPTPGEAAVTAISQAFKLAGDKESKKISSVKSFKEFIEFVRKSKVTSRAMFDQDPESFWQWQWHMQSVTHVFTEHGWAVACEYHIRVLKSWAEGFLDLSSMVDTEECRRGDVEGALHQRVFLMALQLKGKAGGAGGAAADRSGFAGKTRKANADDTYCNFCQKWYPAAAGHASTTCRKKQFADGKSSSSKP